MLSRSPTMTKFNVNFADRTHEAMVSLSEMLGISMADVLREALSLFWWIAREVMAGNRILIQRGDQVTELLLPSLDALRDRPEPATSATPHGGRRTAATGGKRLVPAKQP